ncbi:hypothetical protein LB561_23085 [Mesorhizobium sp. B292B1B]|uniref:hypothetical protein n=1 Tax=unclassified Mesorhizobium TaxID=325217 RepID=UPI00112DCD80|nr:MULTISPECIES: hypothetical protein [unclassified Mesorhizobium]MCA0013174.1 hypothetical protein [Mesorhizobium sp. B294B1A1]MCA0040168.1 hypothetical protein [Mesorhizobium sp. B292B1B]TPM45241.1 hypothetical protein FJ964_17435 [Mesorhizobium sp. B2-3-2]
MTKMDSVALAAVQQAFEKAEPRLAAALAKHGVSSPQDLPPELAQRIFAEALMQTAVQHFPTAQLDALAHGWKAFAHPRFFPAFERVRKQLAAPFDAFAMATGMDPAVVLAGFGLPVAPFDRKSPRILAEPRNNIDVAADTFSKWKTAYVGYSPCDVPFYMLVTDCVLSAFEQIAARSELKEIKGLLERSGSVEGARPARRFQHGLILLPREPDDRISTIFLNNPNPREGSVGLYAGWSVNGLRDGAPNNGFVPVPVQFLRAALDDPQTAMWLWKPVGVRITVN